MKKNISINLFGTLYAIDEDAYTLLERYLNSMKSYFARQEGGEEIADDIEHRVAELLWQQKQQGMEAVNIDMIKSIISKIGNPEEIENPDEAAEEGTAHATADGSSAQSAQTGDGSGFHYNQTEQPSASIFDRLKDRVKGRQLFRDSQNKLLGGVLSGLDHYFGTGDPLWWRLGFVALFLILWNFDILAFGLPLLYALLWIIVPETLSPEDRLRMMGKEVNPQNLNAQILSDTATATAQQNYPHSSGGNPVLKVLFGVFIGLLLLPLGILLLFLVFFILLLVSVFGGFVKYILPFDVFHDNMQGIPEFIQTNSTNIWLCILLGIFAIGIPIFAILRQLFVKEGNLSKGTKVTLVIVWFLSLLMLILTLINNFTRFGYYMHNYSHVTIQVDDYSDDEDDFATDTIAAEDSTYVIDPTDQPTDSL